MILLDWLDKRIFHLQAQMSEGDGADAEAMFKVMSTEAGDLHDSTVEVLSPAVSGSRHKASWGLKTEDLGTREPFQTKGSDLRLGLQKQRSATTSSWGHPSSNLTDFDDHQHQTGQQIGKGHHWMKKKS